MALGSIVKEFRLSAGWTQGKLADKIGKSRSYITRLEAGEFEDVGSSVMDALAKAFSQSGDDFRQIVQARAAGETQAGESISELDKYVIFLHGKDPSPAVLKRLRKLTEALLEDEDENQ